MAAQEAATRGPSRRPTSRSAATHTRAKSKIAARRDEPDDSTDQVAAWRDEVYEIIQRGEFVEGKTCRALAKKWGRSVRRAQEIARYAHERAAALVDPEKARTKLTHYLDRGLRRADANEDLRNLPAIADSYARIAGIVQPAGAKVQVNVAVIEQERARAAEAVGAVGAEDVPQLLGEALAVFVEAKGLDPESDAAALLVEFAVMAADHVGGGARARFAERLKALTVGGGADGAVGRVEGNGGA